MKTYVCIICLSVISPHIGSSTFVSRNAMGDLAARNIIAVYEGKEMPAEIKWTNNE